VTSVLEHPGQAVLVALTVLGVVGICASAFQLWRLDSTDERLEWRLWLLLGAASVVTLASIALL